MSADDPSPGQAKRPSLSNRYSSNGSVSHSLSEASPSHRSQYKPQRHVVGGGHSRLGLRNTSIGKNLNKLPSKQDAAAVAAPSSRTHTRSKSSELATSSSPGRQSNAVKRNATFVVPRNTSHTALKKNTSSSHLPRHGSSKNIMKQARHQAPTTKRTRSNRSDRSQKSESTEPASSPEPVHPTVRFDLGGEEQAAGEDEGAWESTSQSPTTTRSHTRQSSVAGDSRAPSRTNSGADIAKSPPQLDDPHHDVQTATPGESGKIIRKVSSLSQTNGVKLSSCHPPRPLDPDAITSRLLQRSTHNADAQVSNASVTVTADVHDIGNASYSRGSTLADGTPGRDLVSRFINGGSGSGTPQTTFLPIEEQLLNRKTRKAEFDDGKRNKSAPNMATAEDSRASSTSPTGPTATHSRQQSPEPSAPTPERELPQSRTQQKLLLQRTSSMIEPQKHIPAVLPRPGAPQLLGTGSGMPFGLVSGGRLGDPTALPTQIALLFQGAGKEYNVIRRFRAPVADAVIRVGRVEGSKQGRDRWVKSKPKTTSTESRGGDDRENTGVSHMPTRSRDSGHSAHPQGVDRDLHPHHPPMDRFIVTAPVEERDRHGEHRGVEQARSNHRARVSFDLPSSAPSEADAGEGGSFGSNSDNGRVAMRDEAYEICRRLWEGVGFDDGSVQASI